MKYLKWVLAIMAILGIIISIFPNTALAEREGKRDGHSIALYTTNNTILPGDANEDGNVNIGDIIKIERIILGIDPKTPGADATQDGQINMGDVTRTEAIIMGFFPFPKPLNH